MDHDVAAARYRAEIARFEAARRERVAGPEGWLTVVGLAWLHEGSNPIGSDPSFTVELPAGKAPDRFGTIDVESGHATLRTTAPFDHEGHSLTELPLADDRGGRDPTIVRLGDVSFFLIRREGRLAVRIRDARSEARAAFAGLTYFPTDPRWRFQARFEPFDPARTLELPTVLDTIETYEVPGALAFDVEGRTHRLEAYLEDPQSDLFVMFGDLTNATETFGGGRYMYVKPPGPDGVVVLDFNKAYNPPCVFTAHATCALPPTANRLPIAIPAGEKRYGTK